MRSLANISLWGLILLGTIQSGQARPTDKPYNVLTWEEAYAKAEKLLSQMTLEQKVNLTTGTGNQQGPCEGNTAPVEDPYFPALCLNDGPIGLREALNTSAFVTGINSCASFDRDLIRQRGQYMGAEFHDKGVNVQLGPGMNLMRSPRAGRNWEFGSEDPYLLGIVSAETILGIQSSGVMATAKHYIGNEQELNRSTESTVMDDRTYHEIYLWPFARSVEAGVTAVMCAYNKVNGTYACENDYTLNHVLKGELDFKGFVMSDWWATHSTATSANNGMDMSMPGDANDQSITGGGLWYGKNLTDAVKNGEVDESRVHDMALRIAASWYKVGQDKDYPPLNFNMFDPSVGQDLDVQGNHKENIRAMGRASLVLLRNEDSILPLKEDSLKKLAIIGSDAGPDPNGLNACSANSCDNGTLAQGWGSGSTKYPYIVTPIDGIKARAPESWEIVSTLDDWNLDKAAKVAAEGDIAIVFANSDSGEQYITVAGNVGDRNNVSLWNNGDNLIKAVADANENTIVVIHSVGTIDMPWLDHPNIKALVWPGLPGQETGNSLADVLFGDYAPGGKLPYTIAPEKDFPAEPSPEDNVVYEEKLLIGYRWFDAKNITPQFEFGFGLSYTTFAIDDLKVKSSGKGDKIKVSASVTVENTGDMEGTEVVQAYISFPESAGEPPKVLRGFEKVLLKPGKKSKVSFKFTKTELSIWDTTKQSWVVPSGEFKLLVGASSRDIRHTATFNVSE